MVGGEWLGVSGDAHVVVCEWWCVRINVCMLVCGVCGVWGYLELVNTVCGVVLNGVCGGKGGGCTRAYGSL